MTRLASNGLEGPSDYSVLMAGSTNEYADWRREDIHHERNLAGKEIFPQFSLL